MNITTFLIIAAFIIIVALMVSDKINAVVALPLMAVVLCLIVRVPFTTIINDVVGGGILGLSDAIFSTLIAAILGEVIRKTGIAEKLIRSAAELGGDNAYIMGILCFLACAFCFIGLSGVGSKIMLGLIVFPIMLSVGVPKVIAAFVMLAGTSVGYFMNVARWTFIGNLVGLEATDPLVKNTAIMVMVPAIIICILLIIAGIKIKGPVFSWAAKRESKEAGKDVPLYAVLAPVIPLLLVFCFKWNVNTALIMTAINLNGWAKILGVVTMPSISTILSGYVFGSASTYMVYMIPFIWLGNFALVYLYKLLLLNKNINYLFTGIISVIIKVAIIFLSFNVLNLFNIFPEKLVNTLQNAMGLTQLITASIGVVVAFAIYKAEKVSKKV